MRHVAWLALIGLAGTVSASAAEPPSLCQRLAAHVWHASTAGVDPNPGRWIRVAPMLQPDAHDPATSAATAVLATALGPALQPGTPGAVPQVSRLADASLYMGGTLGGSANCLAAAFATVDPHGVARRLADPEGYTSPCWNEQGGLASVLGAPAYVEQGTSDAASSDPIARITPWTPAGWGRACQLTVQYRYQYTLARRYCGKSEACRQAADVATAIARQYFDARQQKEPATRDVGLDSPVPNFRPAAAAPVGPDGDALVARGWRILAREARARMPDVGSVAGTLTSDFPTFGAHVPNEGWESSFSYEGFALFPISLGDRPFLAAIAHNGVGWREGSNILIAVYEPPATDHAALVPLAGLVVERSPSGLRGTIVAEGASAVPASDDAP